MPQLYNRPLFSLRGQDLADAARTSPSKEGNSHVTFCFFVNKCLPEWWALYMVEFDKFQLVILWLLRSPSWNWFTYYKFLLRGIFLCNLCQEIKIEKVFFAPFCLYIMKALSCVKLHRLLNSHFDVFELKSYLTVLLFNLLLTSVSPPTWFSGRWMLLLFPNEKKNLFYLSKVLDSCETI